MGLTPSVVIVQQYFTKRRALAAGMSICGLSVGSLITAPCMRLLIDTYTWRGALLIHGGVILHAMIFSSAFHPLPKEPVSVMMKPLHIPNVKPSSTQPHKLKSALKVFIDCFDCTLWMEPYFVLYTIGSFCLNFGALTFAQHMVNFAVHNGIDKHWAATLPSMTGGISLSIRIMFSFISNMACTNRTLQYGGATSACGFLLVMSYTVSGWLGHVVLCCSFGFIMGKTMLYLVHNIKQIVFLLNSCTPVRLFLGYAVSDNHCCESVLA